MKAAILSAITALAAIALATPAGKQYSVSYARDLDQRTVDEAVDMVFTGPAVLGGPNVTLSGTAESVYNELIKINPNYDAWNFPEYQRKMNAMGFTRDGRFSKRGSTLAKRGHTECNPVGDRVGNVIMQCTEGYLYLSKLNGYCGAPKGWGGCSRVSCSHNCGIFLCNDNDYHIDVWCGNIAGDYLDILDKCAITLAGQVSTCKGQIFRDGPPAWNTVLRSQSC